MAQRFTVDRRSFEQFLGAIALLQQFRPQPYRPQGERSQPLMELLALERAIEQDSLDLSGVMERVVRLAENVICASAVGLWLFTDQDIAYCTGTGSVSNDERLRLEALSKLKAYCTAGKDFSRGDGLRQRAYGAPYYPGSIQSTVVSPVYFQDKVAGVLAAFSTELDAFSGCDLGNMLLLAGVLGQALSKAAETGLNRRVGVERTAMLPLIDQIARSLETMIDEQAVPVQPLEPRPVKDDGHEFKWVNLADFGSEQLTHRSSYSSVQPPVQASDIPAPTESPCAPTNDQAGPGGMGVEDISIPGIGVRAALGSELEEFLPPGPTFQERLAARTASLGQAWRRGFQRVRQSELALKFRCTALLEQALSSIRYRLVGFPIAKARQLQAMTKGFLGRTRHPSAEQIQRAADTRLNQPKLPMPGLSSRFRVAWSSLSQVATDTGNQFRRGIGSLNLDLGQAIVQLQAKFRTLMHRVIPAASKFFKGLPDYIPDLPALPKLQLHWRREPTQAPPPITRESSETSPTRYEDDRFRVSYRPNVHHLAHLRQAAAGRLSKFQKLMQQLMPLVSKFCKGLAGYIPDLPALPQLHGRPALKAAPLPALDRSDTYAAATHYQLEQLRVGYRLIVHQLRSAAFPLGILIVIAAFLILEIAIHNPEQIASASSGSAKVSAQRSRAGLSPAKILPTAGSASADINFQKSRSSLTGPSSTVAQTPHSHLQVTDLETKTALENMTEYEISTLRRAAEYGDDLSAFQLGMAYEVGYQLHQDCAKAVQWVLRAANAGNAAAQYNLALRYRDGDGVQVDEGRAEKWLRKAAEANYSAAKMALANLKIQ